MCFLCSVFSNKEGIKGLVGSLFPGDSKPPHGICICIYIYIHTNIPC